MKQKKLRMILYTSTGLLLLVILLVAAYMYSLKSSVDAMYEPLSEIAWTQSSGKPEVSDSKIEHGVIPIKALQTFDEESVHEPVLKQQSDKSEQLPHDFIEVNIDQLTKLRNPDLSNKSPFSILLIGVDERPGDVGRSDTLILLTISPAQGKALAISIPRDTRIKLPISESYDKINHAYAYGGTSRAVASVERLFEIPIAYYMKTDMDGLVEIVDTVGGVDVTNNRAFEQENVEFPKGELHLEGSEALLYIRMRKEDPEGDFGRTSRQRQVLSASVDRLINVRTLGKFPKLLAELSGLVRTNLTIEDMISLAKDYKSTIMQVDTWYMQGKGTTIKGIYYWVPDQEDRIRIQQELLRLLAIS